MKSTPFDFLGNLDTLIAVIIGAVLATGGALVADVIQDRLGRKRRARDAARFFGEVLYSIDQLTAIAVRSLNIGDNRWGSVTQRMFRAALQEASIYERNRERIFDINDARLRQRIHRYVLSTTIPMVALLEYSNDLVALEGQTGEETESRRKECTENREGALEAVLEHRPENRAIISALEKIAGVEIDLLEPVDQRSDIRETQPPANADS
ncbi:MAG: hypothetical protein AAGJ32_08540 [Pseudomonadota bacterium]